MRTTTPKVHGDPYCFLVPGTNENAKTCGYVKLFFKYTYLRKLKTIYALSEPGGACEWQCQENVKINVCNTECEELTCFCRAGYVRLENKKCVVETSDFHCGDNKII